MSADPHLASIPFIFLRKSSPVGEHTDGPVDGADDFITGPFVFEDLISHIENVLHRLRNGRMDRLEQGRGAARVEIEKFRAQILQNFHSTLRGPLGNVVMSLEMAVSHKFEDPQEQALFVSAALSNPERLESLISDMVLLSEIDQNDLDRDRQPVEVEDDILLPIRRRMQKYEAKGLKFVQDIRLKGQIMAPRREFTQALVRLADNAFKFSPGSGKVELFVSSRSNGGATIFFQDEGPGIAKELREKVFEHFYQINDGKHREDQGLGVGLTIARAVFSSLGGDVRIGDSLQGCRLEAFLPDLRSAENPGGWTTERRK
jgi:signal transduction histidine kinase